MKKNRKQLQYTIYLLLILYYVICHRLNNMSLFFSTLYGASLTAFALYLIYCFVKLKQYLRIAKEVDKFDGPPALPVLGNIPQAMGTPVQIFRNMRHLVTSHSPTFRAWIGLYPSVNTRSPEDVEIMLSSSKNSTKGPVYDLFHCWLGRGLLTSRGKKWYERRKILTPSFHFSVLLQFVDIFNKHTVALVEKFRKTSGTEVDVTPFIGEFTLFTICETAMGTLLSEEEESQVAYKKNIKRFGEICLRRIMNPLYMVQSIFKHTKMGLEQSKICDRLHEFSWAVIQRRSNEYQKGNIVNEDDTANANDCVYTSKKRMAMLDVLLSAKFKDNLIDDLGIREEVDTFIFEGHDTTSVSLSYSLMLLACNRHCQDKIYEELLEVQGDIDKFPTYNELGNMKYLERCIKESLRLYPSVPIISRISEGIVTADGNKIPETVMVNVLIYDLHHRGDIYPDPEKYDPDRFLPENVATRHPFAYVPFSAGPRNCIGQRFAMLEMKACLAALVKNFILEPVDTPETVKPVPDLVLRPANGVKVKFIPREKQ